MQQGVGNGGWLRPRDKADRDHSHRGACARWEAARRHPEGHAAKGPVGGTDGGVGAAEGVGGTEAGAAEGVGGTEAAGGGAIGVCDHAWRKLRVGPHGAGYHGR